MSSNIWKPPPPTRDTRAHRCTRTHLYKYNHEYDMLIILLKIYKHTYIMKIYRHTKTYTQKYMFKNTQHSHAFLNKIYAHAHAHAHTHTHQLTVKMFSCWAPCTCIVDRINDVITLSQLYVNINTRYFSKLS